MNLHQKRQAMKAAVTAGAMPREVADKIVQAERPADAGFRAGLFDDEVSDGGGVVQSGELVLYDAIDSWGGFWGVSADDVRAGLAEIGDVENLTVRINSPGGEVTEGIAIHNLIADHPAEVTVMVDGAAYSIASLIAMAGDKVTMNRGSEMMIHEAWGFTVGDADEMAAYAERLDKASDLSAGFYAARAGGTTDEWRELMKAETWMYAAEAVERGLADEAVPLKTKPDNGGGSEPSALWDAALFGKDASHTASGDSTSDVGPDAGDVSTATAVDASARLRAERVVAGMKLKQIAAELSQI